MALQHEVTSIVAIMRLRLSDLDAHDVQGGGSMRAAEGKLIARITAGIRRQAPQAQILHLEGPPVLGAALIGLDEVDATAGPRARLRSNLTHKRLAARPS